ncbi:MAG TPA: maleylpyruvate isomerase N-terminal domain-containing protein [Acidimicrobiales bacterium]|nr:maleylpyruvate isomerase N-terminal domain-containing protein [Acidimicrobiales bacterium]
MPTRDEFLASLHRDIELFEAAVRGGGDLTQTVDGCGDWTLASLVEHVGGLHRFIANGIENNGPSGDLEGPPENRDDYADWFARGAAALEAVLVARPDDEPCWTFFPNAPQVIGLWVRRMAQELAVHRYDAEMAATGIAEEIDPAIAKDGIDEYFDMFIGRVDGRRPIRIGEATIHLHATGDAEGEWLVRCGDHAPVVTREHAKGDVALTGEASDLLLTMWGRVDPEEVGVAVFGDPEVWTKFQAAASI